MKNNLLIFFLGVVFLYVVSSLLTGYPISTDILSYFPVFSEDHWTLVKNSLLADPVFQFEPWRVYAKERLFAGEFPFWNPHNGFGAPFFANMQSAVLYPLSWIYFLFPLPMSLTFTYFFKLYIFSFFTYLYLRFIKCSNILAFVGGLCAASLGFVITWLQWPHTNVFILFPVILFVTEWLSRNNTKKKIGYVLVSIIFSLAVFGGHPETLFHLIFIYLVYLCYRFLPNLRLIGSLTVSISVGLLLGAIQILPFLEYLFQSNIYFLRSEQYSSIPLPIVGFILNIFPFILGAPHTDFYKPISETTNFQETIGDYVGFIVVLVSSAGFWKIKKPRLVLTWAAVIVVCLGIAYSIFPFNIVNSFPLFSLTVNTRLIGFSGFGMIVLFILVLQELSEKKINYKHIFSIPIIVASGLGVLLTFFIDPFYNIIFQNAENRAFIQQLALHIQIVLLSTLVFFVLVVVLSRTKKLKSTWVIILWIPLAFQSSFFLWNYNVVTTADQYFPSTQLTKKLKTLPPGMLLEVGNPVLLQNSNLVYGLSNAENYDAMEVNSYSKQFDTLYPIKNHLDKVDSVSESSLKQSGVLYIASDYDLRLKKIPIQSKKEVILPRIIPGKPTQMYFHAQYEQLEALRVVFANYNRLNTCHLKISIFKHQELLKESRISCTIIRDGMFATLPLNVVLEQGEQYELVVSSVDSSYTNSVSMWGNSKNDPYIELLFDSSDFELPITLQNKTRTSFLWSVENQNFIKGADSFVILSKKPESLLSAVTLKEDSLITFLMTNYPGWEAAVDGLPVHINSGSFITINIMEGTHIVSLTYIPLSFYIGFGVSMVTFFVLVIYILRMTFNSSYWYTYCKVFEKKILLNNKKISLENHFFVLCSSMLFGFVIFLLINHFFLPDSLPIGFTTSINWLTSTGHSLTLDYIRFIVLIILIFASSIGGWLIFIWKKKR